MLVVWNYQEPLVPVTQGLINTTRSKRVQVFYIAVFTNDYLRTILAQLIDGQTNARKGGFS